jgi:hypothetical protein
MREYTRSELIDLHYTERGSEEKNKLIQELLNYWDIFDDSDVRLKTDLTFLLNKYIDKSIDGPFILLMTMRNRLDLKRRITDVNEKRRHAQLKSFLTHLEEQQKNIYTPDESIRALISNSKYAQMKNLIIVFEIERVRRIRARSTPSNQNLNVCLSILETLEPIKGFDDYGGIYIPSNAIEGMIELQKSLTYARTFHFEETLMSSRKARDIFNNVSNAFFNNIRNIFIWWSHVIDARVYSKCYLKEKARECQNKSDIISKDGKGIDNNKQDFLKSIAPKKEKNQTWQIFRRLLRSEKGEQVDFLHAYHEVLANYIARENVNLRGKFSNLDVENLFSSDIKNEIDPSDRGRIRTTKVRIISSEYKREFNQFLTRGVIGDYNKEFKPQPLLFDHNSLREKNVLSKRMVKNCTITMMLAQTAHERQNSLIILQLTLITIDLLTKNRWLAKIIMQRNKSRGKKTSRKKQTGKNEQQSDEYENDFYHAMRLTEICVKKVNIILKRLNNDIRESPLVNWVNCCAESFPQLAKHPTLDLTNFVEYCESKIIFEKQEKMVFWKEWEANIVEEAKKKGIEELEVTDKIEQLKLHTVDNTELTRKICEEFKIEIKEPVATRPIVLKFEKNGIIENFPFSIYFDNGDTRISPYEIGPGEQKFTAEGEIV